MRDRSVLTDLFGDDLCLRPCLLYSSGRLLGLACHDEVVVLKDVAYLLLSLT